MMVTHENILQTCPLVIDHPNPVVVSWLPAVSRYGSDWVLSVSRAARAARRMASLPLTSFSGPILWFDTITTYQATATAAPNFAYDYCLRAGRLSKEKLEDCDLSSLRVLMCAAEPVKADTYTRFLEMFQPYGLKSESFLCGFRAG